MNWTVWMNVCVFNCYRWRIHVYRAKNNFNSFRKTDYAEAFPYDEFEPVWNCKSKERLPAIGHDGPKWICGLHDLWITCV